VSVVPTVRSVQVDSEVDKVLQELVPQARWDEAMEAAKAEVVVAEARGNPKERESQTLSSIPMVKEETDRR